MFKPIYHGNLQFYNLPIQIYFKMHHFLLNVYAEFSNPFLPASSLNEFNRDLTMGAGSS